MRIKKKSASTSSRPPKRLIEASSISLHRGERSILYDVSLTIDRGEIVTLIGPNGAGKTTLARVLVGVQSIDQGHIWRQNGLTYGYVPQTLSISRTMPLSVERLLTLTMSSPRQESRDVLQQLDIEQLLTSSVHDLSGGQFRRVLLARALLRKPSLLILDEPLQGVDVRGEGRLYRIIDAIRAQSTCGILLISHDLHVVMARTDRVICLDKTILCQGCPQDVRNSPQYAQLFDSLSAEDDLLFYHHHHQNRHGSHGHGNHGQGNHGKASNIHHEPHEGAS